MYSKYQPTKPSCPHCDPKDKDGGCFGFPELKQSTGIRWYCWCCGFYYAKGRDNKFRRIIEGNSMPAQDGELENPGDHINKHAGQRILGNSGPPRSPGTGGSAPTRPSKPTTGKGQPTPKPLPGQGPLRGKV